MESPVVQVAEGIFQVPLPLPFPLRIVHSYLLEDDAGWTVIDAGLNYPPGRAAWEAAFAALGTDRRAIRRVVLTHAHPDHYGLAGWLTEPSGAPTICSPVERDFAVAAWQSGAAHEQILTAMFAEHGLPAPLGQSIAQDLRELREMTQPPPRALVTLEPGAELQIGGRRFVAIETSGHSDGHLVFYCAEQRLMVCGDAVLNKITPNVGLWAWSRPNPLGDFLQSLERLAGLEVDLALPGHRSVITQFGQRLAELRQHHVERLAVMAAAVGAGATAYQVCQVSFPLGELSTHQLRFALAETLAHLEYLVGVGQVTRAWAGDAWRYQLAGGTP